MKRFLGVLTVLLLIVFYQISVQAQTTGAIAGKVQDVNGAIVPGASVTVRGEAGQQYTVTSNDNGTFNIPAVQNGLYTVTVTAANFKTFLVKNVKVDVGNPTSVDATLEAGKIEETVVVTSGGEVLQTQTATVGTTIIGRQITETPIASRDALDLVALLPGTASVGRPRSSSIDGLPKGALSITIDGVDVQDNNQRSADGYFTYVRPRIDAIDEVTVSTSNPGAESSGDGAVQIKFVTKRGTNRYTGSAFWQHRNTALNAAYWYNNRDLKPLPGFDTAPRNVVLLNQYGASFGGPLPFPHFGEGGPFIHSGKDRAFFFANYEEFRLPESQTRARVVLGTQAQAGVFQYITGTGTQSVNLLTIAGAAGLPSTVDPTIATVLSRIRSAVGAGGVLSAITGSSGAVTDPNRQNYSFTPHGGQFRKFLATRFDFNINKSNSVEFVVNHQKFPSSKDFLNSQEERFLGFPSYGQGSDRNSYSIGFRSTLSKSMINEARYAVANGASVFSPGISPDDFAYSGGFLLDISAASVTTPYSRNSYSSRETPTYDFTDSLTWIVGSHTLNFGGEFKRINSVDTAQARIVPTISFGLDASTDATAFNAFSTTSIPGASTAQLTEARALYATLVGRVLAYTATGYLTSDGTYKLDALQTRLAKQETYGLYAQDSWHVSPSLTVNYGLRWQPQGGFVVLSDNYAKLASYEDAWGVSGFGNIFKPGTLTGRVPTVVALKPGESVYNPDRKNFAPTVGAVWSPNFGDKGILHSILGSGGKSVFRGGYSVSYVREGTALIASIVGANPGGNLPASRSLSIGNLTPGTNLRDGNNPNLTPATFSATPSYPITLSTASSANTFDPNLRTGYVQSFSFGYQRELDKNTVIEVRYVGNRGRDLQRQHNINEINTVENGFAAEFALAQANYYFNRANGRGNTFAYTGAGTSPLPKILAYISAVPVSGTGASLTTSYTNALFTNTTLLNNLSNVAPAVLTFAGNIENSAARRANAITAGLPSNFFYVNPTTATAGSFIVDNSAKSWYDSGVIEVRRRLSAGLRVQASYVWSKAQSDEFQSNTDNFANFSNRPNGLQLAKNVAVFDIRNSFKLDMTYDLPVGRGRAFFGNAGSIVNGFIGGWTILPTLRWQSGSPFSFGNVQLVGMTVKDLQKAIKVNKLASVVTYLPDDIILNTQKAFDVNATSATGYGTTFGGGGAPTGRFIAPAGYGNCQSSYAGQCGFNNLIVYGPDFIKYDMSISKKIGLGERRSLELRATMLDALNHPNFRVGGFGADVITATVGGATFGQLASGSAYQDISTTNDPGGRLIDLMLRFNF